MVVDPVQCVDGVSQVKQISSCGETGNTSGDAMDTTRRDGSPFSTRSGEERYESPEKKRKVIHSDLKLERTSNGQLKLGPYVLQKKLGKGAQGVVYLSQNVEMGTYHAVKLVRLQAVDTQRGRKKRDRQIVHIKSEVAALQAAPHANILTLNDFVLECQYPPPLKRGPGFGKNVGGKVLSSTTSNRTTISENNSTTSSTSTVKLSHHANEERVLDDVDTISQESSATKMDADQFFVAGEELAAFVLDLASNGELMLVLVHTGALPEKVARAYFVQLASAIATCHRTGVYHRDLKPENVLLDSHFQIKLADFGMAKLRGEGQSDEKFCSTVCGTRGYMAPEVLNGRDYDPAKADAWSVGVLLFIMLSGNPPMRFAHTSDWWFRAIYCNRFDRFWQAHERLNPGIFNVESKDILSKLLVPDPDKRATVAEVLGHHWVLQHPITSPSVIEQIMSNIKIKADMAEASEVSKALERKRAEISSNNQGRKFDPFVAKHKRSIGKECSHPIRPASQSLVPTLARFYMLDVNMLCESSKTCVALEHIHSACKLAGASRVSVCTSDFRVHVEYSRNVPTATEEEVPVYDLDDSEPTSAPVMDDVYLGENRVVLEIILYQDTVEDAKVLLIEVRKQSGSSAVALGFVQQLKHGLGKAVMCSKNEEDTLKYKAPERLPDSLTLQEMLVV